MYIYFAGNGWIDMGAVRLLAVTASRARAVCLHGAQIFTRICTTSWRTRRTKKHFGEWPKLVSEVSFPRFWGNFVLKSVFGIQFRLSEVLPIGIALIPHPLTLFVHFLLWTLVELCQLCHFCHLQPVLDQIRIYRINRSWSALPLLISSFHIWVKKIGRNVQTFKCCFLSAIINNGQIEVNFFFRFVKYQFYLYICIGYMGRHQ